MFFKQWRAKTRMKVTEHRRGKSVSKYANFYIPRQCSVRRVYSFLREYLARIDTLDSREETLVTLQVHGTLGNELARETIFVSGDMWAPAR